MTFFKHLDEAFDVFGFTATLFVFIIWSYKALNADTSLWVSFYIFNLFIWGWILHRIYID